MDVTSISGIGKATRASIAGGASGVRKLLELMRRNVREAMTAPAIVGLARSIVAQVVGKDMAGEAAAVQAWVRASIRYVRDPIGAELIESPLYLLKPGNRQDDCDGHAQLVAALLSALGHRVRLVAIGFRPDVFAHVYAETFIRGAWVPVETTEAWPLGKQPPGVAVRMFCEIANDDAPTLGKFKLGKIFKKIGKVAKIGAAVTVPGAAAALATVEAARGQRKGAQAQLEAARADRQRAMNEASGAVYGSASAYPAQAGASDFLTQYKVPLMIGGGVLAALLIARR